MAQVEIREQFAAGEKVALYEKAGDWFAADAAGDAVDTRTADESGSVVFKGLENGTPFWAVCGDRSLAVMAKEVDTRKSTASSPVTAGQRRPPKPAQPSVQGARDTVTGKPARSAKDQAEFEKRSAAAKKAAATRRRNAKTSGGTARKSGQKAGTRTRR